VLGPLCAELRARALAAPGWPERFAILDEILLRRLAATATQATQAAQATPAPEVRFAWHQLLRTGGTARISDLAAETGWSGRHLTSRFRTEIGLTPKAAARVIRFDRARHLLIRQAGEKSSGYRLADLAAACGYFDQAHLAREFRALAGCPPSQWITEEFRNIQAGAWLFEGA
jgi:AraC-like DNA-binding protein